MHSASANQNLRVLELFCGIGGCAAALADRAEVVAAVDVNQLALRVYRHNYPHVVETKTIESISEEQLTDWRAELWWMSPPCQPFTQRGRRRDLADPRADAFLILLQRIEKIRPPYLAMENVAAFQDSAARDQLRQTLDRSGYTFLEDVWCSTQFGLPSRRPRYYLIGSRRENPCWPEPAVHSRRLSEMLDPQVPKELFIDRVLLARYRSAMHIVDSRDPDAVTSCFTSAYGRSPVHSGSYLATDAGVRRFSPNEILRLLGFPASFALPAFVTLSQAYRLVGNSLSIPAVRHVLNGFGSIIE
jgi:site-specific DNA-cytosine methylase